MRKRLRGILAAPACTSGGRRKGRALVQEVPCGEQGDPSSHGGADEDGTLRQEPLHDRKRLLKPAGDGALFEVAARFAVTAIVETQEGAALPLGPGIDHARLGGAHVGLEAADPDHRRALALAMEHGDPAFVDVPFDTLLSDAYNDERRKLVTDKASLELRPGKVEASEAGSRDTPPYGKSASERQMR